MKTQLVLTIIGPDRPGLVELVSRTLVDFGANWESSRMARLAGKFAGILRASVPAAQAANLSSALRALREQGLTIVVEDTEENAPHGDLNPPLHLELTGTDREGIVREVTRVLTSQNVNVEELVTERTEAPMSGAFLFIASARLRTPPGTTLDSLRRSLETIADDLAVEITVETKNE